MFAFVLIVLGAVAAAGAVLLTFRGRSPAETQGPASDDPWSVFTPRSEAEMQNERVRFGAPLLGLAALVLIAAGALMLRPTAGPEPIAQRVPAVSPRAVLLELEATPEPTRLPESEDDPSPLPTPRARTAGSRDAGSTGTAGGGASQGGNPGPAATPTPPPKPGPSVGGSVSCFNGSLNLSYSVNARSGTTLSSVRVALDGTTVQEPGVSGRTQYSGSYQRNASAGSRTFTVTATGSDGGVTSRNFNVTCR